MGIRYFDNSNQDSLWSMYHAIHPDTGAYAYMEIDRGSTHPDYGHPPRINLLRSDPSMRTSAMFMLTRGVLDHPGVQASGNLSRHSSRLLQGAVSRGIFPDTEITNRNSLDFEEMNMHRGPHADPYLMGWLEKTRREIPKEDMHEAKQHLKRMLLGSRQNRPLRTGRSTHLNSAQFDEFDRRTARGNDPFGILG